MAYFGGSQNLRGDPGFFGTLFGAAKGFVTGGPTGAIAGGIRAFRGQRAVARRAPVPTAASFIRPVGRVGGIRGFAQRAVPGGATGFQVDVGLDGRPRRRRMNVGNAKALRRAIRRTDGFVRLARGALKNTGFKIVSKSSGKISRATMDKAVAAAHHRN